MQKNNEDESLHVITEIRYLYVRNGGYPDDRRNISKEDLLI